ncbi:unnamed protein product [Ectocarpus sp. CCAP 1310/34]|nr:unnamed protein product [Ectocarpus sp. CCAP 1310/34]
MFLAAVARPRYDTSRRCNFTGKLGIFPFTVQRPAQRNSRNRAAGTMETKCVEVTKEVFKRKVVDEVIPAIKARWPGGRGRKTNRCCNFTGKLGIFQFTVQRAAQRNSRNRAAGTMETKCVEVTKEVFKRKVVDEVFPAIKARWPGGRGRTIYIQLDNKPSHRINADPDVVAAGIADGWDIRLINQPSNSPDTNILDLGFFNAVQSLQDRNTPRTVDEFITEVKRAFEEQSPSTHDKVWVSLQAILQIILAKGNNTFKLPHLKKDNAANSGRSIPKELPLSAEASTAVRAASAATAAGVQLEKGQRGGATLPLTYCGTAASWV